MPIPVLVQIDLSPRQKRVIRSAVVAGAVIGALGVGVAIAAPKYTFKPNDPLSSQKMNDNFVDLDSRLIAVEALGQKQAVTVAGSSYSLGAVYKTTTVPTDGKFVAAGNLTGYAAAKAQCVSTVGSPTAHMCTPEEAVRSAQMGIAFSGSGWMATGIAPATSSAFEVYTGNADCNGFSTNVFIAPGPPENASFGATFGGAPPHPGAFACDQKVGILCCD